MENVAFEMGLVQVKGNNWNKAEGGANLENEH